MSDEISVKGLCPPVNVCLLYVWYTYVCIHISIMRTIYMNVVLCICTMYLLFVFLYCVFSVYVFSVYVACSLCIYFL